MLNVLKSQRDRDTGKSKQYPEDGGFWLFGSVGNHLTKLQQSILSTVHSENRCFKLLLWNVVNQVILQYDDTLVYFGLQAGTDSGASTALTVLLLLTC